MLLVFYNVNKNMTTTQYNTEHVVPQKMYHTKITLYNNTFYNIKKQDSNILITLGGLLTWLVFWLGKGPKSKGCFNLVGLPSK